MGTILVTICLSPVMPGNSFISPLKGVYKPEYALLGINVVWDKWDFHLLCVWVTFTHPIILGIRHVVSHAVLCHSCDSSVSDVFCTIKF